MAGRRDWAASSATPATTIATFSEAMRIDPKNALAFGNRGLAYVKKRN